MCERISVLVFDRESLTPVICAILLVSAHLSKVRVVIIVTDLSFLSCFTVVHGRLDHGLDKTHTSHNTAY